MARTITFTKLWAAPSRLISRLRESEYQAELSTRLINRLWRWDWRESLGNLPPFYLVGDKQDYGKPIYAVPSDFVGLRKAVITRVTDSNNNSDTTITPYVYAPLVISARQSPSRTYGIPETISFEPSIGGFRIFPIMAPSTNTNEFFVSGVYKKVPQSNQYSTTTVVGAPILASELTGANLGNTLLPLDDRHYDLMSEVAAQLARKADALPADALKIDAYIDSLIEKAAREEGVELGAPPVAPREPLFFASPIVSPGLNPLGGW